VGFGRRRLRGAYGDRGSAMKRAALSVPEKLSSFGSQGHTPSSSCNDIQQALAQQSVSRLGDWIVPSHKANLEEYQKLTEPREQSSSAVQDMCKGLWRRALASIPILDWLPRYDVQGCLFNDVVAGVTLALICVVQTLAHASIANTEVIQGPYCAFVPPFVYAVLGTSRHASISSGAIVAILLADQLQYFHDIQDRTELASLLALISGCMLVLMGLCRAAFAVRFLSQSLISGFVTGGSVLIMQGQLKNLCGMKTPHTAGFFATAREMIANAHTTNLVGVILGIAQIFCLNRMMVVKRCAVARLKGGGPKTVWRLLKILSEMKEIVMVLFGVIFAYATSLPDGTAIVPIVGVVPRGLPDFIVPWDTPAVEHLLLRSEKRIHEFVLGGALLALTSFLSTYASAKKQALNHNYRIDASQEIFALGMAGFAGSFFQSFTPSGSLSRTSLSSEMGVKTQLNGIMTTLVIGTVLTFLTPVLYYLPNATLAAIILKSSWNLLDFKTACELRQSWMPQREGGQRRDLIVWCIAFALTICFGALYGIACAVLVAVGLIVYDAATPRVVTIGCVESIGNVWRDVEIWHGKTYPGMLVVEFRGPLFFASAERFQDELEQKRMLAPEPVKIIVLAFGSVHDLDPTALTMLKELLTTWRQSGVSCIIADAKSRVRLLLEKHFAQGKAPLLSQPAFIISVDDAVDLGLRELERRGFRSQSKRGSGRAPWHRRGNSRFGKVEPHVV